jgi:hypothetical protein
LYMLIFRVRPSNVKSTGGIITEATRFLLKDTKWNIAFPGQNDLPSLSEVWSRL